MSMNNIGLFRDRATPLGPPAARRLHHDPVAPIERTLYVVDMTETDRKTGGRPKRHGRPAPNKAGDAETVSLYGLHTVAAALANPGRECKRLRVTQNALRRLGELIELPAAIAPEIVTPKAIDRLVGADAVHQGALLDCRPLSRLSIEALADARLVVVLDQVTDPHNVGAILRTATAFAADAVIVTARYSPAETGVLAKAASGALDRIAFVEVTNLARALEALGAAGFTRIGLDSAGDRDFGEIAGSDRTALVLGAEGKGLRQRTRATCDILARLDMPGEIKSLNVSNASAIALYALTHRH